MTERTPEQAIDQLLEELSIAQKKAARLGFVLAAGIIGIVLQDVRDESIRREEIVHVNDNPTNDRAV